MTSDDPAKENPFESPLISEIDQSDPSMGEAVHPIWIFTLAIVSLLVGLSVMTATCSGLFTAFDRLLGGDIHNGSGLFVIFMVIVCCVSPILGIAAAIGTFKRSKRRIERKVRSKSIRARNKHST